MRAMRMRTTLLGAAMAAMTLAASPALAQTSGLALDRFDPAPAGDRFFGVPSPYAAGDLTPHFMALLDYAHNPLVIRTVPSNNNVGSVVKNQLFLNLMGGISLWSRLYIDVDLSRGPSYGDTLSWTLENKPAVDLQLVHVQADLDLPRFNQLFVELMKAPPQLPSR